MLPNLKNSISLRRCREAVRSPGCILHGLVAPSSRRLHHSQAATAQAEGCTEFRTSIANAADPAAHAAALCRVLGLAQPRLMAMVARCPELFSFSPEALDATLMGMAGLTGLQTYQLPQLVAADPELLLQPDRLKANIRGLAQALGVASSELVALAAREPSVLALSGAEAEGRLRALAEALMQSGRHEALLAAVLQSPGALLVPEPGVVEGQLQALEAALEAVMGEGEGSGDDTAAASQAAVSPPSSPPSPASPPHRPLRRLLAPLVLAKPSLLSTPPQLLAGRVVHLAFKARVSPAQVLAAAPAGPNLLAATSCHIDRHCTAIATSLGPAGGCAGGAAEAAELLISAPRLLDLHVGAMSTKWNLLSSIYGSRPVWAARLAGGTPSERAELLVTPYTTLARLRFLADSALQHEIDPLQAVRLSDPWFHIQYPAFREWLRG